MSHHFGVILGDLNDYLSPSQACIVAEHSNSSVGVGGDGGPVVPLDRDLSIMLIAVGIAYGYQKVKHAQIAGMNS